MQVPLGIDASTAKNPPPTSVVWDSDTAVNGHCLIMGMSGAGKSHNAKKFIQHCIASNPSKKLRVHVFDCHGDLDMPDASTVMFSEQTAYGLNPLRVNPDPHFGGTRKAIQQFLSTLNRCMRALGGKQEACIRNILQDVYARHGFTSDPSTWYVDESATRLVSDGADGRLYIDCPIHEKDELKALNVGAVYDGAQKSWYVPIDQYQGAVTRWPPKILSRSHPSIDDALRYARHILQMSFFGTGAKAITNLEIANKTAQTYQRKLLDALKKRQGGFSDDALESDLEKAKEKTISAFTEYANAITTGRELDDLIKYSSTDVLKSVIERLENLSSIGIFKPSQPPFDPSAPIWRYNLRALSLEERKLFVLFKLEDLFLKAVERGESHGEILDIIFLDEAHIYSDDDPENPINTIAKEARKFGVALICASQAPTHFSDDFITSVATKIILGIDESFWRSSVNKLMIDLKALEWIKLQRSMLVQIKTKGDTKSKWTWTLIPHEKAA